MSYHLQFAIFPWENQSRHSTGPIGHLFNCAEAYLVDSESRWHFKSINIHTQGDTWSLFPWCQTRSRISLFEILIWKYFSASTALTEKKSGVECTHDNKASSPHKAPRTQPAAALKRKYKKNAPTPTTREIEFFGRRHYHIRIGINHINAARGYLAAWK